MNQSCPTCPSISQLRESRTKFAANEPRDLFYRAAIILVEFSKQESVKLSLAEAIAILLQTWNKEFYRFHTKFDAAHFEQIEQLLAENWPALIAIQPRR